MTIDVCSLPQWTALVKKAKGAYDYLEDRLNNRCAAPYWCKEQHRITGLLRAFNPAFGHGKVDALWVQRLASLPCFAHIQGIADLLRRELPDYLIACQGTQIDHRDMKAFSREVLQWWASNNSKFPTWSLAARIAFCLSPNSACCERVFSLLQCMFGANRASSLADQVEASVLLRFNCNQRRKVAASGVDVDL